MQILIFICLNLMISRDVAIRVILSQSSSMLTGNIMRVLPSVGVVSKKT